MEARGYPLFIPSVVFNLVALVLLLVVNKWWPPASHGEADQSPKYPGIPYLPGRLHGRVVPSTGEKQRNGFPDQETVGDSRLLKAMQLNARALLNGFKLPRNGRAIEQKPKPTGTDLNCHCGVCADTNPCCRAKDKRKVVYLAIMCKSAPGNFERRQKMRRAWEKGMRADSYYNTHVMEKLIHFSFVIGKSGKKQLDESVDGESRLYNDTAVGNFKDTYQNLTSKLLWSLTHVQQTLRFRYLLMADDDAFINLNALIQWLVVSPNERFYSGMMEKDVLVVRDPESKWYVRRSFYGPETYPPYHQGFGYVTSCDSVEEGMRYVSGIPLFGIDDTVMGMLMFVGGVKATHMPRFHSAPYYCQKFQDKHPLVIGDVEVENYDMYTKDLLEIGCGQCSGKHSKPPKSSAG